MSRFVTVGTPLSLIIAVRHNCSDIQYGMVLEAATPEEIERHRRAIERLRAKLFRIHSPADFGVISEAVIPVSVEGRWLPEEGSYRVVSLGGLQFELDLRHHDGIITMQITHWRDFIFLFALMTPRYTVNAFRTPLKTLDRVAFEYVDSLRRVGGHRPA
jgi:hypothetical protein